MRPLPPEFSYLAGKALSSKVYPEFFRLSPEETVLNVGFGDGPQAVVYAGAFRRMVGVDVNRDRLARARRMLDALGIHGVDLIEGNVERIPLPEASFDAVLAVDIIEHVERPDAFLAETRRLLRPGGRMLITFPAMHDRFVDAAAAVGRLLGRKRHAPPDGWHPDWHQRELPVRAWREMAERAGFRFARSRATTMFPPLHLYGAPRFWLRNPLLHAADRAVASLPLVQSFGQTVMVEFMRA